MPCADPARPRKMLPPPTTMQISLPALWASATSRAMRSITSISTPNWPLPINASPETLSNIRRYFGAVGIGCCLFRGLAGARHLGDFIGEVGFDLFDALAHLEADKAFDLNRGAQVLGRLLDQLGDRRLAVEHVDLL